jgi:hypothetical protein
VNNCLERAVKLERTETTTIAHVLKKKREMPPKELEHDCSVETGLKLLLAK